jgi:hypothetical protein
MKTYNTKDELIKDANETRLANKNNWVVFQAQMNNYILMFKMFDTWVQRLEVYKTENGTNLIPYFVESSPMELNVKGFSNWIDEQISTLN